MLHSTNKIFLFFAIVALFTGCVSLINKDTPAQNYDATQVFTSTSHITVRKLSAKEAKKLATHLFSKPQGKQANEDFSFALSQSILYATSKPGAQVAFNQSNLTVTYAQLANTLTYLKNSLPKLTPNFLATQFFWYRLEPNFGITGYYEPTLKASKVKTKFYSYPLYRLPADVKNGIPYLTRHAIDREGALQGQGLEIAWVSDEIDAFFLHVQGSGRLQYQDGSASHILFAGKNNHEYKSLGKIMREEGLLKPDNITMQSIKKSLQRFPEKKAQLFDRNPRYIFFREAQKGPIGSMGKPLTPYISLATDPKILPHGSLTFLATSLPDTTGSHPFSGLMLPQDTGGAIKKNRIDLFCGPGNKAEYDAGHLNASGFVFLLIKK